MNRQGEEEVSTKLHLEADYGADEEIKIPENHVIVGYYGTARNSPNTSDARITSLGFIVMDISALNE